LNKDLAINPQVFSLCIFRPNVFIKLMTFFSLTLTSNIRFAWGIPRNTIMYNPSLPFFTFELFYGSWWAAGSISLCISLWQRRKSSHERSKEWDRLQFSIVEHKDYHECREEIPQRNKALSILVYNVYTAAVFCQDAQWRKEPSHLIAPSFFLHDRTPVCDLLFDTKQVPFSILYPKLSIPYYIKERTPVDIVFLSAWWQVHYIYTQRHTCNCHLFQLLFIFLRNELFPWR
jgi:hypothetical protein